MSEIQQRRWGTRLAQAIRQPTRWLVDRCGRSDRLGVPVAATPCPLGIDIRLLESRQLFSATQLATAVDLDDPLPDELDHSDVLDAWPEFQTSNRTMELTLEEDLAEQPLLLADVLADQLAFEDELLRLDLPDNLVGESEDGPVSWEVTLGDGSPLPDWLSFDPATFSLGGIPLNEDVGSETIRLHGVDSDGHTAQATFELTVLNSNDPPQQMAELPRLRLMEDSPPTFINLGEYFADADLIHGDRLRYFAYTADPTVANVAVSGRFMLVWLVPDQAGETSIGITIRDEFGPAETMAELLIDVVPVNDAPDLRLPETIVGPEDSRIPLEQDGRGIEITDADVGTPLDFIQLSLAPGKGMISVPESDLTTHSSHIDIASRPDGSVVVTGPIDRVRELLTQLVLTPPNDFHGSIDLVVELIDFEPDGSIAFRRRGPIDIIVEPIDDDPVLARDHYRIDALDSSKQLLPGVLDNDSDIDSPLIAKLFREPVYGRLRLKPDGSFWYQPLPGFVGQDRFLYAIVDDNSHQTQVVELTVTVPPPARLPWQSNGGTSTPAFEDPAPTPESDPQATRKTIDTPTLRDPQSSETAAPGSSTDRKVELLRRGGDSYPRTDSHSDSIVSAPLLPRSRPASIVAIARSSSGGDAARIDFDPFDLPDPFETESEADSSHGSAPQPRSRFRQDTGRTNQRLALDDMRRQMVVDTPPMDLASSTAFGTCATLTVGYYAWSTRRNYAVAGALSALPVWGYLDPVQLMERRIRETDDDETLAVIIERENQRLSEIAVEPRSEEVHR